MCLDFHQSFFLALINSWCTFGWWRRLWWNKCWYSKHVAHITPRTCLALCLFHTYRARRGWRCCPYAVDISREPSKSLLGSGVTATFSGALGPLAWYISRWPDGNICSCSTELHNQSKPNQTKCFVQPLSCHSDTYWLLFSSLNPLLSIFLVVTSVDALPPEFMLLFSVCSCFRFETQV